MAVVNRDTFQVWISEPRFDVLNLRFGFPLSMYSYLFKLRPGSPAGSINALFSCIS